MKEIIIDGVEYIITPKIILQPNEILVPDNIELSKAGGSIAIHNGKHRLYYAYGFGSWIVGSNYGDELIKCKLVPCKWEDIEYGDAFYMDDEYDSSFDNLKSYAIKLDNDNHMCWIGHDCIKLSTDFYYYWKVVQI